MRSVRLRTLVSSVAVLLTAGLCGVPAAASGPPGEPLRCALPAGGAEPRTATPAQVGMDATKLAEAIRFAASRNRLSVRVFRFNCLVAEGPLNPVTNTVPLNVWSSTKSVVSILAGIAHTQGRIELDAPIGRYLPAGAGWGDAAHRAITVRQLLNQESGLKQSIGTEAASSVLGLDTNVVKQALALPIVREPGTYFDYGQRPVDLLAHVVERAVGQDLQTFAQHNLFGPIGISRSDYVWLRDRTGNTYGFANLYLKPGDLARVGLLLLNNGDWRGKQVFAPGYLTRATKPSDTNPCYSHLFWLNRAPCVGPSIPSRHVYSQAPLAGMPSDAYATVGFLHQSNFVVPSLGLVVTWTGVLGDHSLDPATLQSISPNSELHHGFFRLLGRAFTDLGLPDPGPYRPEYNFDVRPGQFADPEVLLGAFGIG
ncbi:hydrolase [Amycolatopsis sp. WAC 04182]|uniref:serine hydrolase domain-containing protein n=1 Tax=Amycolatopsis sp. WAC 04182 TaxID=2203198 RepID=UPI000F79DE19|nr:serine hydrolase [Amycolatopsis sp. WAC 04182]RSN55157.1 hydrolase [Amycolatopsis sp. WAC 04182]